MSRSQDPAMRTRAEQGGGGVAVEFFQAADVGCARANNEDAVGFWPWGDGHLFAVADGLGGHDAGEVASALALEVLARETGRAPGAGAGAKHLKRAVQQANLEIYQKAITVPELRRMGTTLTASLLSGGGLVAAHVGDSRLYLLRDGALAQLTKDHTAVWEQVEYGILSPEEAARHPGRHALTRYLGHNLIAAVDIITMGLESGDVLVQCSDGVHDVLPEAELTDALRMKPPEAACREIVRRCLDAGGADNMSVQVAAVVSCVAAAPAPSRWRFWRPGPPGGDPSV